MGVVDTTEWVCALCSGHPIQNDWVSRATTLHQIFIKLEHSSMETNRMIQKATAMGNWWLAASLWQCTSSCITSPTGFFGETSNHPGDSAPYSPDLAPCDFWLFPKLKSPLKGKRFKTLDEIQENTTEQLMVIGRTVCGPKVSTLKGDWGVIVLCTVFLVPSSINVPILHITWLDTFWTDHTPPLTHPHSHVCIYIYETQNHRTPRS